MNCEESPVDGCELCVGAGEFEVRLEFAAKAYTSDMKFIDFLAREGILCTFATGTAASEVVNVAKVPSKISFRVHLRKESSQLHLRAPHSAGQFW